MVKPKVKKVVKKLLKTVKKVKMNKLGRRLGGSGAYSSSEGIPNVTLFDKIKAPFLNGTPSKGFVNRGARALGEGVGHFLGMPGVGTYLGNAASSFARMLGFGKYHVRQNSFIGATGGKGVDSGFSTNSAPTFYNGNGANCRIRHKELVTTLSASNSFQLTNYLLNPGNPTLTSWLSQFAALYEQFRIHGMIFEFKPNASFVTSSGGLGFVNMATDYDCYDTNFASKLTMDTQEYSTDGSTVDHFIHPIECDPNRNFAKTMWISQATTSAGVPGDARLAFLGNFQVAVSGTVATGQIGEIWVHYDIEFERPTSEGASSAATYSQHAYGTSTVGTTPTVVQSNIASTVPMSTTTFAGGGAGTTTYIQFNPLAQHVPGVYLCASSFSCTGTTVSTAPLGPQVPGGSTASLVNNWLWDPVSPNTSGHDAFQSLNFNATGMTCYCLMKLVDLQSTFQMPIAGNIGTANLCYWDAIIAPWNQLGFKAQDRIGQDEFLITALRSQVKELMSDVKFIKEGRSGKDEIEEEDNDDDREIERLLAIQRRHDEDSKILSSLISQRKLHKQIEQDDESPVKVVEPEDDPADQLGVPPPKLIRQNAISVVIEKSVGEREALQTPHASSSSSSDKSEVQSVLANALRWNKR
jgi:hypothetical protein